LPRRADRLHRPNKPAISNSFNVHSAAFSKRARDRARRELDVETIYRRAAGVGMAAKLREHKQYKQGQNQMKMRSVKSKLYLNASLVAVCGILAVGPAMAQDAAAAKPSDDTQTSATGPAKADPKARDKKAKKDDDTTVLVVGVRRSMQSAQQVKKADENVVDVITATDAGAFPDKSVAEALQRVAGVTVSRFGTPGDARQFSAEPSGVIVRGLSEVKSEFNGRDTFSADSSRGLSWDDITPELMSRIDVYKNQSADLIEGGIAGLIDLHTRVPFDSKKQLISFSADDNYSVIGNKNTPSFSGLYSNRWETPLGEFGVMLDGAYSHTYDRTQSVYNGRYGAYQDVFGAGTLRYIPAFISARDSWYDRQRTGVALSAQWQNNEHTMIATGQYNRSDYKSEQTEYNNLNWIYYLWGKNSHFTITPSDPNISSYAQELPGQPFTFNADGSFQSGVLSSDRGWWGGSDSEAAQRAAINTGQPLIGSVSCSWSGTCDPATANRKGVAMEAGTRRVNEDSMTEDSSMNFKWHVNDRLLTNFDVQYVHATKQGRGAAAGLASYIGLTADYSGDLPKLQYTAPLNVNLPAGGYTNPDAWRYDWIQQHREDDDAHSLALQADGEWLLQTNWLSSLKFGVRTTDREQVVQNAWPFTGVTGEWGSAAYYNTDKTQPADTVDSNGNPVHFNGYPDPSTMLVLHSFPSNFMGGGVKDTQPLLYLNPDVLGNAAQLGQLSNAATGIGSFDSICSGVGTRANEIRDANGNSTCYTPAEHLSVAEKTKAVYLMLRYGGPNATVFGTGITVSGNIGVRYVETRTTSRGSVNYNGFTSQQLYCAPTSSTAPTDPNAVYTPPANPYTDGCYIVGAAAHNAAVASMPDTIPNPNAANGGPATIPNPSKFLLPTEIVGSPGDLQFHDGGYDLVSVSTTHHNWLPSFNLKVNWSDKWISHLAYSKAMSRPDLGLFRYQVDFGQPGVDTSYAAQCKRYDTTTKTVQPVANCTVDKSLINVSSSGELLGASPQYQSWTGNPFIKPITADNYDFTLENYFSQTGSFTLDLFYKKFYDYIEYGQTIVPLTHNGVTRNMLLSGPLNGNGASVKGYEVAFHRFFDFLPSPWNGLGIEANYTHLTNTGISNFNLDTSTGTTSSLQVSNGVALPNDTYVATDRLEGMSDNTYNIVGLYEHGPWALRLAYNWRSKYLVTANDCCNYPEWQSAQGFLDGSIRYKVNDHIELGLLASNILNTTTRVLQQVTDATPGHEGTLIPGAWFKSDRRVIFSTRFKY
jgi:TonB-dependent receptor